MTTVRQQVPLTFQTEAKDPLVILPGGEPECFTARATGVSAIDQTMSGTTQNRKLLLRASYLLAKKGTLVTVIQRGDGDFFAFWGDWRILRHSPPPPPPSRAGDYRVLTEVYRCRPTRSHGLSWLNMAHQSFTVLQALLGCDQPTAKCKVPSYVDTNAYRTHYLIPVHC